MANSWSFIQIIIWKEDKLSSIQRLDNGPLFKPLLKWAVQYSDHGLNKGSFDDRTHSMTFSWSEYQTGSLFKSSLYFKTCHTFFVAFPHRNAYASNQGKFNTLFSSVHFPSPCFKSVPELHELSLDHGCGLVIVGVSETKIDRESLKKK